jgi:hypothetical protein
LSTVRGRGSGAAACAAMRSRRRPTGAVSAVRGPRWDWSACLQQLPRRRRLPPTDSDDDEHSHPDGHALDPLPLLALLRQRRAQHRGHLAGRAGGGAVQRRLTGSLRKRRRASKGARAADRPLKANAGRPGGCWLQLLWPAAASHSGRLRRPRRARAARAALPPKGMQRRSAAGAAGGARTSAAAMSSRMMGSCRFSQHSAKKFLEGTSLYLLGPNTRLCSAMLAGDAASALACRPSWWWLPIAFARPTTPPRALSFSMSFACGCVGPRRQLAPRSARGIITLGAPGGRQPYLIQCEKI